MTAEVNDFVLMPVWGGLPVSSAGKSDQRRDGIAPPEIAIATLEDLHPWTRDRFATALATIGVPLGVLQAASAGHRIVEGQRSTLSVLEADSMPGSGHFMMLEDPKEFNERLDALLKRLQVRG